MVWIPRRKELGWFDIRWRDEPIEAYEADFAEAPAGAVLGEATPTYLHTAGAIDRVLDTLPGVRLIVVLREPVARLWSHHWYRRNAQLVDDRPIEQILADSPRDLVEPGRYGAQLAHLFERVDRDRVLVLFTDDLAADPAGTYRRVCRHLGVDEVVPAGVGEVRNASYVVRYPRLRSLMLRLRLWKRLPFGLGYRIDEWNRTPFRTPPIPADVEARVRSLYADDTALLTRVLDQPVPWA